MLKHNLREFGERLFLDEKLGAAGGIGEAGLRHVDAQVLVERGEDLLEVDGTLGGFFAEAVGGADDLADAHSAAGEERAAYVRPVVAAGLFVDARSAAELAPNNHGHVVE